MTGYLDVKDTLKDYIKQEGVLEGVRWITAALHVILMEISQAGEEVGKDVTEEARSSKGGVKDVGGGKETN